MTRSELHERFNTASTLLFSKNIEDDLIDVSVGNLGTKVLLTPDAFTEAFKGQSVNIHSYQGHDHLWVIVDGVKFTTCRPSPTVAEVQAVL